MSDTSYSLMLRQLSNDYYQYRIDFEQYRIQRKLILDKIDAEFNGEQSAAKATANLKKSVDQMQTIAFYQNSDVKK
jgi:hypothetical protein